MATISVPLDKAQEDALDTLVKSGAGSNRADVMRKALQKLAEAEAVEAILRAEREISLGKGMRGDLRKLLKKMP